MTENDPRIVEIAATAMGRIGDPFVYERLVQLLRAENIQHRVGAIWGLELLGNPAAVEPLLEVFLSEDRPYAEWGESIAFTGRSPMLHRAAAKAINTLTGEDFNGDVTRIRIWIEEHLRK